MSGRFASRATRSPSSATHTAPCVGTPISHWVRSPSTQPATRSPTPAYKSTISTASSAPACSRAREARAPQDGVSIVSSDWLAQHLGVNPTYSAGFQGIGQITGSVALAVNAIASGAADYVLMHRALHNPPGRYHANPMQEARGAQQWTAPQGFFGPLAMIALPYNEYLQRYGARRESMAAVVVEARKNGARIPWSFWHDKPLSREDYLAAPMLVDPVCRYDCDIPVDGVAAFVFTSAERARDLPHPPVYVTGYASGAPIARRLPLHWPLDDIIDGGARDGAAALGTRRDLARRCRPASGL